MTSDGEENPLKTGRGNVHDEILDDLFENHCHCLFMFFFGEKLGEHFAMDQNILNMGHQQPSQELVGESVSERASASKQDGASK